MTCENCIHYEVCPTWDDWNDDLYEDGKYCGGFKKFKNKDNMQEIKHGKWIEYQIPNIICCSECDWGEDVINKSYHFCPNCGAKMDTKDEDTK